MNQAVPIPVMPLGQAGFRLDLGGTIVLIDPYLSDYAETIEGSAARRMIPIVMSPGAVHDTDWVLITHAHIDHCDPWTLVPLSRASQNCRFMAPATVCKLLEEFGIGRTRLSSAEDNWTCIGPDLHVRAVPAAHPQIQKDQEGRYVCVGYLISFRGMKIYHSGDTSVDRAIISDLQREGNLDVGFIAVNERNFYRDEQGIIGNMSVRDAFRFAEDIRVQNFVPTHWDMFSLNSVYLEELELLYRKLECRFKLSVNPGFI